MKWTLEFNVPEDNEELKLHQNASKYHSALCDIQEALRGYVKYESRDQLPDVLTGEELQKWFHSVLKEMDIEL